ncbi:gliding motility-associated C-terminal domain-containing protein, partial [Dokdonia sinensis]
MPNDTPDDYALCDFDGDGLEVFDLTSREMDVLGGLDPLRYSVTWYADLTNAQNGTTDIPDETNHSSTGGDVYAVVQDETQSMTTFCQAIVTLTLVVEDIPVPNQPAAYELCDDLASGSRDDMTSLFDLTSRESIIIGANTDWSVTWYQTQVGADTADPAALIAAPTSHPYTSMVTGNIPVWARVVDTSTMEDCHAVVSLTLVVVPNPSPTTIPDVEECDGSDGVLDNQAIFDLTDEALAIANGELVTVTFYESEQNAIDAMSPVTTAAYQSGSRTLWARSTEDDPALPNTACFTIIEVTLVVRDTPEITATAAALELTACDDADGTMDGNATFDLTQNDILVLGTLPAADYSITYHETQASAETPEMEPGHDAIATPAAYNFGPPATTTIWVRLQDTTQANTACAAVTSFTINVGDTPTFTTPATEYFACDSMDSGDDMDGIATFDLTVITDDITNNGALTNLEVTYYADPVDIVTGMDIQPQDAYQGTGADPQTITILITSTDPGMCSIIQTTDLRVDPVPVLISDPLPDAIACDPDNDDFSSFDLDAYATLILNGQTTLDLSFYELQADAQNGDPADAITNTVSYDNIVPNQVLYVRAQDNVNATACAKVFPFTLQSHPTPVLPATALEDIVACDDDGDSAEEFDLTVYTQPLLDAQLPLPATDFTVSYHDTQASAEDVTDPGLTNAADYDLNTAMSPLTIYVRILYTDGSDCATITTFDISVEPLPTIGNYLTNPLEVCDDDNDQFAVFDLTQNQNEITTDPLLQVDYYASQADFDAGNPVIVDPTAYTNIANPQVIIVVVTSQAGCEVQTDRTLRVLPLPTPDNVNPEDVVVCDDDFDGRFDFDLTPTVREIDPASAPTVIRIFESFAQAQSYDAVTNTPAPATDAAAGYLYTNSVPNGQTLYARVDHDPAVVMGNTCAVIVPFEVVINPLPVVNPDRVDPYVFCEQEDGDDSMGMLILENIAGEIDLLQAPQVEGDFFITYHEDQSQALTDDFALSSPYNFDENVLTGLWIRIENRVTGCFVVEFLEIVVEARPVAQQPEDLMVCEDIVPDMVNGIPTPGTATIDLTVQDEVIFGGPLGPTDQVNYFTSLADAEANDNAIADPTVFVNTSDPQVIWAVVEDTTTTCPSSPPVSFAIDVKEVPYTDLSDTGGDICVDPTTGEILEPVILDATPETIIAGAIYTYAWRLDGSLISIDPTVSVEAVGTYSVTVTAIYTDVLTGMVHECSYEAETTFTAISGPLFQVEVLEDAFNAGGTYTVQVVEGSITGFGAAEYEFAIDDGPFGDSTVFTNVRPGEHTVFGRRKDGNCPATPVEVGIIDYPRFFTPNNDGFHDRWNILGIGTPPNLNAKIFIFDRYGKLLKQLSPTSPGWNGTFNGQPMPSNDYWFRVEYNEADENG